MADSDLETQDKTEEVESPSFLPFGILNGTSFMVTLACLGLTIFAQAEGNSDLNIFLWTTSGCALTLCLLEFSFCMVGFLAICRKDYTVLLACSSLVATCGIIHNWTCLRLLCCHDCICYGGSPKKCQDMSFC